MMKNRLAALISISILFASVLTLKAEVVDKVLAVVNDELITQSELDKILIPIFRQYKTLYAGDELLLKMDETRKTVLNHMINDKLILNEARKREIEIKPAMIEKKIEDIKGKFPTEEGFKKALINQGVTKPELYKRFEEELLKAKFINTEVRSKVVLTPTEISEHYNSHIEEFRVLPQVQVSNIFIRIKEDETGEEAHGRAKNVIELLRKGEDFSELAKTYSDGAHAKDGGNMGYIAKGQLKKDLDELIFSLKVGQFSDIVESDSGYRMFTVLDKKEEVVLSLEDAYDKIRDVLYRQKAKIRFEKLIEELKKDAYISIR